MRRFLVGLSMLAMGCSTDTFIGADGSPSDDGGQSNDAGVPDAPFDVASCAPGWCKQQTLQPGTFCTDFDESASMPADWGQDANNGTTNFVAAPAEQCLSLHAHLGAAPATSTARNSPRLDVHEHGDVVARDADPRRDAAEDRRRRAGLLSRFVRAASRSVSCSAWTGSFWLQSSLGTNSLTAALASDGPVRGAFTHMQLDVTYLASGIGATLTYRRGGNGNSDTINANATAIAIPTQLTYAVGLEASTQTTNAIDAYYDDVLTLWQ